MFIPHHCLIIISNIQSHKNTLNDGTQRYQIIKTHHKTTTKQQHSYEK